MAERLYFNFIRTSKETAIGEIAVDVLDPTDVNEIKQKLNDREFARFFVENREFEDQNWKFLPIVNIEPEPKQIA